MNKSLLLIGYRGTGKTVFGKVISKKLGKEFIDTDRLIVKLGGKSIPQIFEDDGEEEFRRIETEALKQATKKEGIIISCGGGIIVKERNFELLSKGVVCLLTTDAKTIYDRIYNDDNRPSLTNKDPFEEINHLLKVRGPLYARAKDFEIKNLDKSINQCADEIIEKFNELNK